jgi:predicted dehydrogenase
MTNKHPVLLVGCGNIGALYDFKKEGVRTHAKAFSLNQSFQLTLFDENKELAAEIADHYKADFLTTLNDDKLAKFEVVVISTPTFTHYNFLGRVLALNVPVIVCEKPITDSIENLEEIKTLKKRSPTKVIVNYFRRFHPCYGELKEQIKNLGQGLTNIQITYQRGFLNNATHALDLINFLFEQSELSNIKVGDYAFDEFEKDPTLSLTANFNGIPVTVQGLQFVKHSFFEIKLWFQTKMIGIENNGQTIRFYESSTQEQGSFYLPLASVASSFDGVNAIEDAMKHLADKVFRYINEPSLEDNFESSYIVNHQALKIIETICRN